MAKAELLRAEEGGSISFGDYTLPEKAKLEDFPHEGDLLKVKTYKDITKLEKNGLFVYESVPGTRVENFLETAEGMEFTVSGAEDAQITLGMEDDTTYEVFVNEASTGKVQTGLGGKLSVSAPLAGAGSCAIRVVKA